MSTLAPEALPPCYEGSSVGKDPQSGAVVTRLTSAALISNLIYCEQPYGSPDGKRIIFVRTPDFYFSPTMSLIVGDVEKFTIKLIERAVPHNFLHSAWGEWFYYFTPEQILRRVSLQTLEREEIGPLHLPAGTLLQSITPDNRVIFCWEQPEETVPQIVRYDLESGERKVIFEHVDNINPHLQVEWASGRQIVMQLNHPPQNGEREWRIEVVTFDIEGNNFQSLPIGGKWTAESSGHMAWIGDSGRIACAVNWDREKRCHDPRHPHGNLIIAAPGDKEPHIFTAPEHGFYHVSISRCGRYFVCDDFMDFEMDAFQNGHIGPARIVVGNLETGKYRVLIQDCHAYGICSASWSEPVPYFTADNRHVIYNASPYGINQIHVATVPSEFLASLD